MTRFVLAFLAGAAALMTVATGAMAQDGALPGPVARLVLAARLEAHALAQGDALSAVAALRLASRVGLRRAPGWVRDSVPDGDRAPDAGLPPAAGPGPSALALLTGESADAILLLAQGNDDLLDLAEAAIAEAARPRTGGANWAEAVLPPATADRWTLALAGDDPAEIGLFSDGTRALGWVVADAAGTEICASPPHSGPLYCAFTPAGNAFFTITVTAGAGTGADPDATRYALITD